MSDMFQLLGEFELTFPDGPKQIGHRNPLPQYSPSSLLWLRESLSPTRSAKHLRYLRLHQIGLPHNSQR